MNKIPKGNNKKINSLKINKKLNKESICGKMKIKILSNKKIIRTFGQDISNLPRIKENNSLPKKSSSCNNKVSYKYFYIYLKQKNNKISIITNSISSNNRNSNFRSKNKINVNNIRVGSLNNITKAKRVLTLERRSLDIKHQQKEKINNTLNNNSRYEKNYSYGNKNSKNNHKICPNTKNLIVNNKIPNGNHIIKKNIRETIIKKIENNMNILTFSNPNLM